MEKAKKKQEAIARMEMLKLYPNIIKEFSKDDIVNMSENGGFLYWLDDEQRTMVKDFETEHDALVYHVIHSFTDIGEMYALLYVSDSEEEWEFDREDLQSGIAIAYVKNVTDDWCSEFGSIGIKQQYGGLIRTA